MLLSVCLSVSLHDCPLAFCAYLQSIYIKLSYPPDILQIAGSLFGIFVSQKHLHFYFNQRVLLIYLLKPIFKEKGLDKNFKIDS